MNVKKAAQLLSDSVVQEFRRYRKTKKFGYLFKDSETTERLTKLMNDVFDVMNDCLVAGIRNWYKRH